MLDHGEVDHLFEPTKNTRAKTSDETKTNPKHLENHRSCTMFCFEGKWIAGFRGEVDEN